MVVFHRAMCEDVMGASLKVCDAAYLRFPPRVVIKIWQGCRYGCEGWCCKTDLNIGKFLRRTWVSNTEEMVVFLRGLGEDVMGAFLKECEPAYLPFPPRVVNKIWQRCRYGCDGLCCGNDFNTRVDSRCTQALNPHPNPNPKSVWV